MLDDEEKVLIERSKKNHQVFGLLYERYVDQIYRYIYYKTGNVHDAEDLTARVFLRAIRHINNYQDRGVPFSAWLYRIAFNLLANWYRDQSKRAMVSLDLLGAETAADGPEVAVQKSEQNKRLLAAISRLADDRQDLLLLKYVEKLSNAEIGIILGRSEGAVKSLYYRTLIALRVEMDEKDRFIQDMPADQDAGGAGESTINHD